MAGCSAKTTEEITKEAPENIVTLTDAQLKNANIATDTISPRSISSVIKLNGKIDVPPQNMVSVSMPLGGYLTSTRLLPGMHVSKGETIAIMKDGQYIDLQQNYLTTKSKLAYSEAEYNRQKNLNTDKTSSDKVLQQSEVEYETQKVLLHGLGEKLKLININPNTLTASKISGSVPVYSPIDGFVSKVDVNIGKYVNPSDVLFELVNPTDIHLNLIVFEKDVSKLFIGQKLIAYTNNQPSRKIPCEIILINKDITGEGTAEVHCHFENYPKDLLPGMYMNAEVEVKSNNAYTVPEESVVLYGGKQHLFIDEGSRNFSMQEVETGTKENGFIEVMNSETLRGKKIVVKGAYTLLMALKNKQEEE
jgi:cobalt-zinc-cadmium efflux system membrane fusion protein